MLAPLVAVVRYMPLERKILLHKHPASLYLHSVLPSYVQKIPDETLPAGKVWGTGIKIRITCLLHHRQNRKRQAFFRLVSSTTGGGASAGLSAAPQAAGASCGLVGSAASRNRKRQPGAVSFSSFHPDRFESAIVVSSIYCIQRAVFPLCLLLYGFLPAPQVRTFL